MSAGWNGATELQSLPGTQSPPHRVKPLRQVVMHLLALQTLDATPAPWGQLRPHPPQFFTSLVVFTAQSLADGGPHVA